MKVTIEYPIIARFTVHQVLPEFDYGCPVRTSILRTYLTKRIADQDTGTSWNTPHTPDDFVVGHIRTLSNGDELWTVDS